MFRLSMKYKLFYQLEVPNLRFILYLNILNTVKREILWYTGRKHEGGRDSFKTIFPFIQINVSDVFSEITYKREKDESTKKIVPL